MDSFPGDRNSEREQQHFHVLAVDDSLIDRKLLERLLTVSSYQVTFVESGDKALEYLGLVDVEENGDCSTISESAVSEINLIITDYSMPGISGYDLLKRIKDSSWKHIPVVVMSSENEPSRVTMCLEGGAEEFLVKPVKLSDLRKLHSQLQSSMGDKSSQERVMGNKRKSVSGSSSDASGRRKSQCTRLNSP